MFTRERNTLIKGKIVLGLFLLAVATWDGGCWLMKGRGKMFDNWETSNPKFRIKITGYEEGVWTGGANYVFQSAFVDSDEWHQIMTVRQDDPVPIPRRQVHFLDDQIGYVFMGWMYAVTVDAGSTWYDWNAEKDLPNWQCCNYALIKDVSLSADGTGTMKLNAVQGRSGEVPELHTQDYGRHWTSE
jgi:hypothetical protein